MHTTCLLSVLLIGTEFIVNEYWTHCPLFVGVSLSLGINLILRSEFYSYSLGYLLFPWNKGQNTAHIRNKERYYIDISILLVFRWKGASWKEGSLFTYFYTLSTAKDIPPNAQVCSKNKIKHKQRLKWTEPSSYYGRSCSPAIMDEARILAWKAKIALQVYACVSDSETKMATRLQSWINIEVWRSVICFPHGESNIQTQIHQELVASKEIRNNLVQGKDCGNSHMASCWYSVSKRMRQPT
jgi:hypothetical protein